MYHAPMHFRTGAVAIALAAVGCAQSPQPQAPVAAPLAPPVAMQNGSLACEAVFLVNMRLTCVVPLSEGVRAKRESYLALVVKDGRPVAFERRHGAGGFNPNEGRSIFRYDLESGNGRESEMHEDGRMIEQTVFEEGGKLRIFRDPLGRPFRGDGSDATRSRVEPDARGFEGERRYYDENDKPVRNARGLHMVRYRRNDAGLIVETTAFDERGAPAVTNEGWHRIVDTPGINGCIVHRAYYGTHGERVLDKEGTSGFRRQCDPQGNPTLTDFLSVDDRLAVNIHGHAGWTAKRDEHGNPTEITMLGLDGKPLLGDRDYAIERRRFDAAGRAVQHAFFGPTGIPVTRNLGYSSVRYKFDDEGHMTETRYFDESERPVVPAKIGYATEICDPDARGRLRRVSYYDAIGRPARDRGGALVREYEHDEANRVVSETMIEGGRPHDGRDGWARQTMEYSPDGGPPRRRFYRASGEEVELLAAKMLVVTFAGAKGVVASIRSKSEARERAEQARARLLAGERWADVARFYDEAQLPLEGVRSAKGTRLPELDQALEKVPFDGISEVIETKNGYFVMQRIR
jgi:hypothetical protein